MRLTALSRSILALRRSDFPLIHLGPRSLLCRCACSNTGLYCRSYCRSPSASPGRSPPHRPPAWQTRPCASPCPRLLLPSAHSARCRHSRLSVPSARRSPRTVCCSPASTAISARRAPRSAPAAPGAGQPSAAASRASAALSLPPPRHPPRPLRRRAPSLLRSWLLLPLPKASLEASPPLYPGLCSRWPVAIRVILWRGVCNSSVAGTAGGIRATRRPRGPPQRYSTPLAASL